MRFPTMPVADGVHRPMIPLTLQSATGQRVVVDALIDTGADVSLISETTARALGLVIDSLSYAQREIRSPLGSTARLRTCELVLELRQRPTIHRWTTIVGVLPRHLDYAILGTRGFFEFFNLNYSAPAALVDVNPDGVLPT